VIRVRIAPSPTGNLHIGTARTAVFNWLFARHHSGQFILRIEDTDQERSRPEYTQNILDGLYWLGLTWDEGPIFQSQRPDLYRQAIQALVDRGLAYRCYTSEAELEELRSAQKARGEAPRYDNRHRHLTPEQQAAFEAAGRSAVIRFKIDDQQITWHDLVRGTVSWQASDLGGDMVIARAATRSASDLEESKDNTQPEEFALIPKEKTIVAFALVLGSVFLAGLALNILDLINALPLLPNIFKLVGFGYTLWFGYQYLLYASNRQEVFKTITFWREKILKKISSKKSTLIGQPLYNLAVVVDDIDMKISHVIRGEDHIANTAKQILLYKAFSAPVPKFAHTPLILNQEGRKLSKREGVTAIADFRQMGYVPEALVNYMTLLGWSPPEPEKERFTLAEAAEEFGFERVNKAGAKFDWAKLDWLNSQYLHEMPVEKLTDLLIPYWQSAGYEFDPVGERPWLEQLTALIGPSLTRLTDAVTMSHFYFVPAVELDEAAITQVRQPNATDALQAILTTLDQQPLTAEQAQTIINQVVKEQKLKKGLVLRSLRAALMGEMNGPDLIQSWLLLNQHGLDRPRLQAAIS